jgi:NADPH2:quinone reductase
MRAVQIERFGGPEVLEVAEISSPEPQGDEVVVGVEVAGVNRADLLTRAGLYYRAGHPPLVMRL